MVDTRAVRILLADDHGVVRRGVRELLADALPRATFGEAATSEEALRLSIDQPWDLVVLDISMPGRGGLETLKQMRAARPGVPVLILSHHAEDQYAIRALRAGAAGYVTKSATPEELVKAAQKALDGGKYVTPALAERLANALTQHDGGWLHESLSDREMQVLRMLANGRSVKEIGAELSLSEKTISTYRTRILDKLAMKSNAELMRYALRVGLVD